LYAKDWAHFTGWCELADRRPLPADAETVRWYLTDLESARTETGTQVYQPATVARRLAAIAAAHRDAGHLFPTRDPRVHAVLSTIRRTPRPIRPLRLDELKALLGSMDYSTWPAGVTAARDAFALLAGYAGALPRSELAALTLGDLTWHTTDGLHVRSRSSRTDQDASGATFALPYGQHPQTCPPCAFLRWATLLSANQHGRPAVMHAVSTTPTWEDWTHLCSGPHRGAITFHSAVDTTAGNAPDSGLDAGELLAGLPKDQPVLCAVHKGTLSGRPISGDGLHGMLKRRATAAGIPGPVSFYSLHAGGANGGADSGGAPVTPETGAPGNTGP
jgi:hypothetical protein